MEILDLEQGSKPWFEARNGLPTASCFSKIITPKTGKLSASADAYIAELIAETKEDTTEQIRSYWMERGRLLEGEARAWYEFETDTDAEKVGLILNHGVGYSPDGLVKPKGGLEIKCPMPKTHIKYLMAGEIPTEYKPQLHGGLYVAELDWIDFLSYCPGYNPLLIRVVPDDYTKQLAEALWILLERYEAAKKRVL